MKSTINLITTRKSNQPFPAWAGNVKRGYSAKSDCGATSRRTVSGWKSSLATHEYIIRTTSNSYLPCGIGRQSLEFSSVPLTHSLNYSVILGSDERASEPMTTRSTDHLIPE